MIAKPVISPDFTIEDIHKIREYHYELTKDMTKQERINFYNEGGESLFERNGRKKATENVIIMETVVISPDFTIEKQDNLVSTT